MDGLVFSEKALADLDAILDYVAQDKPNAAYRLVERIIEACERLAQFPNMGASCDEILPGMLAFSVGSYVVYYRQVEQHIEIERVYHGARDRRHFFR